MKKDRVITDRARLEELEAIERMVKESNCVNIESVNGSFFHPLYRVGYVGENEAIKMLDAINKEILERLENANNEIEAAYYTLESGVKSLTVFQRLSKKKLASWILNTNLRAL